MSKCTMRDSFQCPIFGPPKDFVLNILPTKADVLRCCQEVRRKKFVLLEREPSFSEIADEVRSKLILIWRSASIPTVSDQRIKECLTSLHKQFTTLKKVLLSQTTLESTKDQKVASFKEDCSELFNIAACKCIDLPSCSCPKEKKVPALEHAFFLDQRGKRRMVIGSVDVSETKKIHKRAERSAKRSRLEQGEGRESFSEAWTSTIDTDIVGEGERDNVSSDTKVSADDTDFDLPLRLRKSERQTSQCRLDLSEAAVVAQRYGISQRAAAHLSSSVMVAANRAGLISADVSQVRPECLVIDKRKIQRENFKIGSKLKDESRHEDCVRGLYFDGRKDDTLTASGFVKEEHISLVAEPGSKYIGHVVTPSGSAHDECDSIYQYVTTELNGGFDSVVVVGCDGTNTNTGWKGGIIRLLEERVNRPLQWVVCLLHFNELPFRSLFTFIDGPTSGPSKYSGKVGKLLPTCETLAVVAFQPIQCDLPEMDATDLSSDQRYLHEIADAIRSGECSPELASRKIGPINMARWLTTANRILRLYISTKRPTQQLQVLVQYLLTVYVPLWFTIRREKSIGDGSRHLFQAIKLSRFLPVKYRNVVNTSIQTNSFFAMPENVLLGMVTDPRLSVRQDALTKILQAKKNTDETVRYNIVPTINFQANDYTEMINWEQTDVSLTVPPVLMYATEAELTAKLSIADGLVPDWEFTSFPCHTVAVERTVKLVTEASQKCIGPDARDRHIRSTLLSRKAVKLFDTKKDFVGAIDDIKS